MNPVSTSYNARKEVLIEISKSETTPELVSKSPSSITASTPEEALEILKNEPDYTLLSSTLKFLNQRASNFRIETPGAISSQLVHILVSESILNYWTVFAQSENSKRKAPRTNGKSLSDLDLLLSCLRSVLGLNAILLSLKQQIQASKENKKQVGGQGISEILAILLQVLETLLKGDDVFQTVWEATWNTAEPLHKRKALWNEFLGLLGGKVLGVAAEAENVLNELSKKSVQRHWIADGSLYAAWVAGNISNWSTTLPVSQDDGWKACSEVLSKSLRLGHTGTVMYTAILQSLVNRYEDSIIKEILNSLLLQNICHQPQFLSLLSRLPNFEQRNFLHSVLKILARDYLSAEITTEADSEWWEPDKNIVAAAAGLIHIILAKEEARKNHLIAWLTGSSGAGIGDGIAIRRAVLAALAEDKADIETIVEKSIRQFGDQLYIKHVPSMQQEGILSFPTFAIIF